MSLLAGADGLEQQDGLSFDEALTKYVGEFKLGQVSGPFELPAAGASFAPGQPLTAALCTHPPVFACTAAALLCGRQPAVGAKCSHDPADGILPGQPSGRQGLGLPRPSRQQLQQPAAQPRPSSSAGRVLHDGPPAVVLYRPGVQGCVTVWAGVWKRVQGADRQQLLLCGILHRLRRVW